LSQIIVPDMLVEAAERQWAPPTDPVFLLVPTRCEEHIASVYVQLGSPEVGFHSFWDVYNQLRNAVDSELLFESNGEANDDDDDDIFRVPDADQRPLQHLQPCEFGKNGIPPALYEGREIITVYGINSDLLSFPELAESDRDSGIVASNLVFAQVLIYFSEDDIAVPFSDPAYELY
jgi:hypothetical protein